MSTALQMLALNVPLSQWKRFISEDRAQTAWHSGKNTDKVAAAIFAQLGHDEVIELVAKEFDQFPADLRLVLRTLCNNGNGSGNVRKGVQRLDKLMDGRLLREVKHIERFQQRTADGWRSVDVNPAIAGAARKYAIVPEVGKTRKGKR